MESLHPRVLSVWILKSVLLASVLAAAAGFLGAFFLDGAGLTLGAGVFAGVLVLLVAYQVVRFRVWGFEIRDDCVYLQRGVFVNVKTLMPFVRIQHVDTQRSPLERIVGLSSIVVYTAGSRGADATIPGLLPDQATGLRETLKDLAVEGRAKGDAV